MGFFVVALVLLGFLNEENGLGQCFLVVQSTFSVEQDGFTQTQVETEAAQQGYEGY